MLTDTQ